MMSIIFSGRSQSPIFPLINVWIETGVLGSTGVIGSRETVGSLSIFAMRE